ncbi:hypothetical protein LTR85_011717 [Meristemomyces frigidus]|nr:hypothetical protein LTR85_011717 [Meristemomyces frigidus]
MLLGEGELRFEASPGHCYVASPKKALYFLCRRLVYPSRYYSLSIGRGHSWMSHVTNGTVALLIEYFGEMIKWWPPLNDYNTLRRYATKLGEAGHGQGRVFGFIDGTFNEFCRPRDYDIQRATYSGYYCANGQKFQCITATDGLVVSVGDVHFAPVNDWQAYEESGVVARLCDIHSDDPNRPLLFMYGDSAYQAT